jgi:hypothetical protein
VYIGVTAPTVNAGMPNSDHRADVRSTPKRGKRVINCNRLKRALTWQMWLSAHISTPACSDGISNPRKRPYDNQCAASMPRTRCTANRIKLRALLRHYFRYKHQSMCFNLRQSESTRICRTRYMLTLVFGRFASLLLVGVFLPVFVRDTIFGVTSTAVQMCPRLGYSKLAVDYTVTGGEACSHQSTFSTTVSSTGFATDTALFHVHHFISVRFIKP